MVTLYLKRKGGLEFLVTAIPCMLMPLVTNRAMIENERTFLGNKDWLLAVIGAGIFALALWMTVEAVITFTRTTAKAETAEAL